MGSIFSRSTESRVEKPVREGARAGVRNPDYAWSQPFSAEGTDIRDTQPEDEKVLKVVLVNLNIPANTLRHKTSEYDITETVDGQVPQLVIRRGHSFDIEITFNRAFNRQADDLRLVFEFGENPLPHKATHVEIILSDADVFKKWGARILKTDNVKLTVRIFTPPTLYVGKWSLKIDVIKRDDASNVIYRYSHDQSVYILFNPWCKDDTTFLHDETLLEEYVLSDTGIIYRGNAVYPKPKPWNFAQFDSVVLDCALLLLDRSKLPLTSRGDPIRVVRRISALANAQDDNGILVGDWSGNYGNETSPSKWTGSLAILKQYYDTKTPVCYGQCWVFSGLVTTLCRTLGIPTRSVTNFASAHDVDGSITVDKFWEYSGSGYKPLEKYNWDSVWNFHVWNEVWMSRPDLPTGYGGWQAIDATPQETSDGIFCCGPMSVIAIQRGEVSLPYDGPFIFAEVNSDKVHWVRQENGTFQRAAVDKRSIGRKASTYFFYAQCKMFTDEFIFACDLSIGRNVSTCLPRCKKTDSSSDDREDITDEYKFKEGTMAERTSVITANTRGSSRSDIYDFSDKNDVKFELSPLERIDYGNDFEIAINLTNESSENRTVDGFICTNTIYYTGVAYKNVKEYTFQGIVVEPGQCKDVKIQVLVTEYIDKLIDHCNFHISCACRVKETNQVFTEQDCLTLEKPDLTVKTPEKVKIGEKVTVEISFTNPLPVPLTNCELRVEGPGLQRPLILPQRNVDKKALFKTSVEIVPTKRGQRKILANFNATEIYGVMGFSVIIIEAK